MPDWSTWTGWIFIALRLLLAVLGALLTFYIATPLVNLLLKQAYRKPPTRRATLLGRVLAAALVGLLIYIFAPIGGGGTGWGWGNGLGPGEGPGKGPGLGSGASTSKESGKNTASADAGKSQTAERKPVVVEMVISERYKPRSERYYLIGGEEPALTLAEVEKYLRTRKDGISELRVIVYRNSMAREAVPTQRLEQLAERLGITCSFPPEFRNREKKATE